MLNGNWNGLLTGTTALALVAGAGHAQENGADACAAVAEALNSDATTVTAVATAEVDPQSVEGDELAEGLGKFCRVSGTTSPVEGSEIGFEVWMPAKSWNGRLTMFGNGGYGSSMAFDEVSQAVADGYAATVTDTGHEGSDPNFAEGRPESIVDWAHRAVHETIGQAETAVGAYYGRDADYTYFDGCSTGGQQAFSEAQRYPEDFDGILAGSPGHNRTHLNAGFMWLYLSNHEKGVDTEQIVPNEKMPMVGAAVFEQCKAQRPDDASGLASDAWLNAPLSCEPDLTALACEGEDGDDCLTDPQIEALQSMYDGIHDSETGELIYFGWPVGSENAGTNEEKPGWSLYWSDFGDNERPARVNFWRIWGFDGDDWSWWNDDLAADIRRADDNIASTVNAMDADISAFREAGGKMIHYHGLGDPVVPALDSISYYRRVQDQLGDTSEFYRMFLVPGMEHCGGGAGANQMDLRSAIEAWVENDEAPEKVIAAHHAGNDPEADVEFTRPVCPYPQRAFYDGSGPEDEAASFTCRSTPEPEYEELGSAYLK